MEQAITNAEAEWTRMQMRAELARTPPPASPAVSGRRLPPPPSWWKGDEDAVRGNLIAAQQLRGG